MKLKLYILFVVLGLVLCACESAPDRNQQAPAKISPDVSITSATTDDPTEEPDVTAPISNSSNEIVYSTLKEEKERVKSLAGKNLYGFNLPARISMPNADDLCLFEVSCSYDHSYDEMLECIKGLWADYEAANELELQCNDFDNTVNPKFKVRLWFDENRKYIFKCSTMGTIVCNSIDDSWQSYTSTTKKYDILWGDQISDDEGYDLLGGYMSVNDAVKMVEDKFNTFYSAVEQNVFTYKVQQLSVATNSVSGTPDYYMILGREYTGIPIDTCMPYYNFSGTRVEKAIFGESILVIVHEKDKIACIDTYFNARNLHRGESIDKIVSFDSALKLAKKEIATIGLENIEQAGLCYYHVQDAIYNDEGFLISDCVGYDENTRTPLRPYWLFAQKKTTDNFKITPNGHGTTILVDALDGTVYYFETTA